MNKSIGALIVLSLLVSEGFALQLKDFSLKLPKVTYKDLNDDGLDDSEEITIRRSLRPLLKDSSKAPQLRDKSADPLTYSLVQEIDLENMGWNIRLIKAKIRQAIIIHVRQKWDLISKTTINSSGSDDFSVFEYELKKQLNEDLLVRAYGENWLIYELPWLRVRVYKNKNIAQIITQQDYLADSNRLTEVALTAHAAGDGGPKAKYKNRGFGEENQLDKGTTSSDENRSDEMFFEF